jgi:hypothetical protein
MVIGIVIATIRRIPTDHCRDGGRDSAIATTPNVREKKRREGDEGDDQSLDPTNPRDTHRITHATESPAFNSPFLSPSGSRNSIRDTISLLLSMSAPVSNGRVHRVKLGVTGHVSISIN